MIVPRPASTLPSPAKLSGAVENSSTYQQGPQQSSWRLLVPMSTRRSVEALFRQEAVLQVIGLPCHECRNQLHAFMTSLGIPYSCFMPAVFD
jgi:hypothetical protein